MARRRRITRREIKEDKFILTIYETWGYATHHVQELLIGAGIVIVAAVAGYLYASMRQSKETEASRLLAPGLTAFQEERFDDAAPVFERIRKEYGGTASAATATIDMADTYFRKGKTDEALAAYQEYLKTYEGDDDILTLSAKAGIAACMEQQRKYPDAAKHYQQLAERYPKSYMAPSLLLDAGRCYQAANQADQAKTVYDKIVKDYKDSRFVRDARMALASL